MEDCLKFDSLRCSSNKVQVFELILITFSWVYLKWTLLKLIYPAAQISYEDLLLPCHPDLSGNLDFRYDK